MRLFIKNKHLDLIVTYNKIHMYTYNLHLYLIIMMIIDDNHYLSDKLNVNKATVFMYVIKKNTFDVLKNAFLSCPLRK